MMNSNLRCALDPGHFKPGSGAVGFIDEAAQAWKLSGYITKYLILSGVQTYLTRAQNEKPELDERAQRAKNAGCALLVSVHFNAGKGDGAEAWVQDFNKDGLCIQSDALADHILDRMQAAGQQIRGVKIKYNSSNDRDYYGILYYSHNLQIVAILLEVAFVDSKDAFDFDTDAELDKWGQVIAGGICDFLNVLLKLPTPAPVVPKPAAPTSPVAPVAIEKGMKVRVKVGAKDLNTGKELKDFVFKTIYDLQSLNKKTGRAVIGLDGKVTTAVNIKDLYKA